MTIKKAKRSPKKNVTIYTTSTCLYCKMAKEFFAKNKIKYKEINVTADNKAGQDMIKKSRQMGVPVIEINGKIIVGYDRHEIEKALR